MQLLFPYNFYLVSKNKQQISIQNHYNSNDNERERNCPNVTYNQEAIIMISDRK